LSYGRVHRAGLEPAKPKAPDLQTSLWECAAMSKRQQEYAKPLDMTAFFCGRAHVCPGTDEQAAAQDRASDEHAVVTQIEGDHHA